MAWHLPKDRYPLYAFYPRWKAPPAEWVDSLTAVFTDNADTISTVAGNSLQSDGILETIRPGLVSLGFDVESGKKEEQKIYRPVFFGGNGIPQRQYEIDAYNPKWKVALEVEAARAWMGNAIYRDVIQMSLLVDVDYAVVAVPLEYRYGQGVKNKAYDSSITILDAIYGGRRLELPFQGFLLIGY